MAIQPCGADGLNRHTFSLMSPPRMAFQREVALLVPPSYPETPGSSGQSLNSGPWTVGLSHRKTLMNHRASLTCFLLYPTGLGGKSPLHPTTL